MKRTASLCLFISMSLILPQVAVCQSADELITQFDQEYEALQPPSEGSSVGTDYKIRQTALAASYSARILGLLYNQNQEIAAKYDQILQRYDEIIRQNEQIIELLSTLVNNQTSVGRVETQGTE